MNKVLYESPNGNLRIVYNWQHYFAHYDIQRMYHVYDVEYGGYTKYFGLCRTVQTMEDAMEYIREYDDSVAIVYR